MRELWRKNEKLWKWNLFVVCLFPKDFLFLFLFLHIFFPLSIWTVGCRMMKSFIHSFIHRPLDWWQRIYGHHRKKNEILWISFSLSFLMCNSNRKKNERIKNAKSKKGFHWIICYDIGIFKYSRIEKKFEKNHYTWLNL